MKVKLKKLKLKKCWNCGIEYEASRIRCPACNYYWKHRKKKRINIWNIVKWIVIALILIILVITLTSC